MAYNLLRTKGVQIATYEELCTLLAETDACLNSRNMCAVSNDPLNPTYLSTGNFLNGEPLTQLPSGDYTHVKCTTFQVAKLPTTLLATKVINLQERPEDSP
jgi:hypothetical protein